MPIFVPKDVPKGNSAVLTEQQLKEIFKRHDANGDGQLNKAELKKAFQYLGSRLPSWRVNRALHLADANGDGCISEKEMMDLVKYAVKLGYTVN